MRLARVEEAERSQAVADLREAELARLEMLQEALAPVLAQVPDDVEMFDCGLVPGPRPRLFVDMVAHVEMGHDKRVYRFIRATRHGRVVLAETRHLDDLVDAVTGYVAHRLVERERALSAAEPGTPAIRPPDPGPLAEPEPRGRGWTRAVAGVMLEYVGIAALGALLLALLLRGHDLRQVLGR